MKLHFDAVFYYVSDLERSIHFYADVLGMRLVSRDVVARFDIDGVLFEIVPTADEDRVTGRGNARLCLRVDDIAKTVEELRSRGIPTTPAQDKGTGKLASFRDPDGNEICLWQYAGE